MIAVSAKPETTDVAIVEDNAALGSSLRKVVESDPTLRCIGVWTTAEDALKKIDAFRPQIVLMDINLPGMSGFEAVRKLGQSPETRDIPVVALSAAAMVDDRKRAGAAGFYRYLTKPVRVGELLQTLEELLARPRPERSSS